MRLVLRGILIFIVSLMVACTASFRVSKSANPKDPIILKPGSEYSNGNLTEITVPEIILNSSEPIVIHVGAPDSLWTIRLTMCFGRLCAQVPRDTLDYCAELDGLTEELIKALSSNKEKLKLRNSGPEDAYIVLAMSLAERLPRLNSKAWVDSYNYDPNLRALALVPGMRLRLENMLPVTADTNRASQYRSQGSVAAPAYLYVLPNGDDGSITLSPTMEILSVYSEDSCERNDCIRWRDASGLHNLLGKKHKMRFWTLLYPKNLGPVDHLAGQLQFVGEELLPITGDVPAVLLVGTTSAQDMSKFLKEARQKQQKRTYVVIENLRQKEISWRQAFQSLQVAAKLAYSDRGELVRIATYSENSMTTDEYAPVKAALDIEVNTYKELQQLADDLAIDCSISPESAECFVLRYRVLPVPEVLVTIQGVQRWVEIGTTVGMALAQYESIRTSSSLFADDLDISSEVKWRNRQSRIPPCKIEFTRRYMGERFKVLEQPDTKSPDNAVRQIILQTGDEIKWQN